MLYLTALLLWLSVASAIILTTWHRKKSSVGLITNYIIFFAMSHWVPALILYFPWYDSIYSSVLSRQGLYYSLIGLISFGIGTTIFGPFLWEQHRKKNFNLTSTNGEFSDYIPLVYIMIGFITFLFIQPILGSIPTVGAFLSNLGNLIQIGVVALYWQMMEKNNKKFHFLLFFSIIILIPLIIIIRDAFLSFGLRISVFISICLFHFSTKRQRLVLPSVIIGYIILSLFASWMSARSEIRNLAWYGNESKNQFEVLQILSEDLQFFDIKNSTHLTFIERRFAYNYFIGLSAERISETSVDFAGGRTITDAFLMVIPRAIWPEKPIRLGGDKVIAEYTGIDYLGNTTVQPGQVMEFYINFGVLGIIIGFAVLGTIIAIIDEGARKSLEVKNWYSFAFWLVPGFQLLQVQNSLVAIVGGSISGLATVYIINILIYSIKSSNTHSAH